MRSDHLKRHVKHHEKKPQSIDEAESSRSDVFGEMKHIDKDETHRSGTCGQMENVDDAGTGTSSVKCTNIDLEMLEKNVESYVDEFNRKNWRKKPPNRLFYPLITQ